MTGLDSGQRLSARYIVRERLGSGPGSESWRAFDEQRNREVVLKLVQPDSAAAGAALAQLRTEIQTAALIQHASVAGGYSLEQDGERAFLVRDYMAGSNLAILRGQDWTAVTPVVAQVAVGLAAMHVRGLVHRDIKTGNIILTPDGTAKIIDLGVAALLGDARAESAGSPYSASPQQIQGEPPSPADDSYSLGVLLYELLSGYPPFYPNISRERVLNEPAPVLKPVHPTPEALQELVMSLLAKDPQERPSDLTQIAQQLRALSGSSNSAGNKSGAAMQANAPESSAAVVRPIMRMPGERRPSESSGSAAGRGPNWLFGTALTVLVGVVVVVFVFLPQWTRDATPPPPAKPAAAAVQQPKPAAAEVDLRALAADMERAEQVRGVYDSLERSLQERGAAQWAAEPYAKAKARGDEAFKQFEGREFSESQESYKAAIDLLQPVTEAAARVLREQLAKGGQALAAGQSAVAQQAFALARRIEPDNGVAAKGLKRAESVDRVFALLNTAGNEERAGQLASAAAHFEEALKLDPDTAAASAGLARMRSRIAADQFASLMSQGLRQTSAGQLADARKTLEQAGRLRPQAREVTDALAQVALAEQRRSVAAHRQQAEDFERNERWSDAQKEYDAALKLDASLEFARAGRDRVAPRVELAHQFETLVSQPDRLLSPAVRDQARALLDTAGKIAAPGPVLRQQMERVRTTLAQAEVPVRVALESDNQTEVVINRVGKLGVFARRDVELTPGTYTVVGTRLGYRDVRRNLTVLPGQTPPPLVVRCEDRI